LSHNSKSVPKQPRKREIIGMIPAGGTAQRIAPLPLSKELYPMGFQNMEGKSQLRPKVVCHYLLEKFQCAGVTQTYVVLRKGKWDIPSYFGGGNFVNMHLCYLIMRKPFGPPFTLDQAFPFIRDKFVVFGFPDIMFEPVNVFKQLLNHQEVMASDIVLALFPAHNPQIMDMVDIDKNGKVHTMFCRPAHTDLHLCWVCGVWSPVFTQFMHDYLKTYRIEDTHQIENESEQHDLTMGDVIRAAIKSGLVVHGVTFPDGQYLDIGTPEGLVKSVKLFGSHSPRL